LSAAQDGYEPLAQTPIKTVRIRYREFMLRIPFDAILPRLLIGEGSRRVPEAVTLKKIPDGLNARKRRGFCGKAARRSTVSAVLKIMMDRQSGLRKRTRGDEHDHQTAA
jgi:hypothetical protein